MTDQQFNELMQQIKAIKNNIFDGFIYLFLILGMIMFAIIGNK